MVKNEPAPAANRPRQRNAVAKPPPAPEVSASATRLRAVPDNPQTPQRKRRNRRSEETISNILATTEQIVLESGADRISILDVCKVAGISRGTFYRYFASQDELLDAFSRHKRDTFHHSLLEATGPYDDPDKRFEAFIGFLDKYLELGRARRLLLVAPDYALNFFKRIFHDSIVRFEDVLGPVFDVWDERLGARIDRELICELLIRYVMSEVLVPSSTDRHNLPRRVARLVAAVTGTNAGRGLRR